MDACKFSQFDNLVSIINCNEVYEPEPYRNCKMINIIGEEYMSLKKIKNYKLMITLKKISNQAEDGTLCFI